MDLTLLDEHQGLTPQKWAEHEAKFKAAIQEIDDRRAAEQALKDDVAAAFDVAPVIKEDHFTPRRRLAADTLIFVDPITTGIGT